MGTTKRTNDMYFEFLESVDVKFELSEMKVSEDQPYDKVVKVTAANNEKTKWKLTIEAGRHKSGEVANWFMNQIENGNCIAVTGSDMIPKELNFAFSGVLFLKKKGMNLNLPVVIGQGSDDITNNWWIGAFYAKVSGMFYHRVLNCTVSESKGNYYFVQFLAKDNKSFKLEYTRIDSYIKDLGAKMAFYYDKLDGETDEFCKSETSRIILDTNIVKLPIMRQSHDFTCGVACVSSILRYAGYDINTREDRLLKRLGSSPDNGTSYKEIKLFLSQCTIDEKLIIDLKDIKDVSLPEKTKNSESKTYDDTFNDRIEKLKYVLTKDKSPVLCIIQAWGSDDNDKPYTYSLGDDENGHYVIAVGYKAQGDSVSDEDYIIFMDPSTSGAYTYITVGDFRKRWHDADDNGKLICPGTVISYLVDIDKTDKIYPLG